MKSVQFEKIFLFPKNTTFSPPAKNYKNQELKTAASSKEVKQQSLEMRWKRKEDEMLIKTFVKYMAIMS